LAKEELTKFRKVIVRVSVLRLAYCGIGARQQVPFSFNVLSSDTPRLGFSCTDNFLCAIYRVFQKAESLKHHIFAIISYTVT